MLKEQSSIIENVDTSNFIKKVVEGSKDKTVILSSKDYLDGETRIPYYIYPAGEYIDVGDNTEKTLDSSFYEEFIINLFSRVDNLIDIDKVDLLIIPGVGSFGYGCQRLNSIKGFSFKIKKPFP